MRIVSTPSLSPHSTPPSSRPSLNAPRSEPWFENYVWSEVVPRLIHPTKLALIRGLIRVRKPDSVDNLIGFSDLRDDPKLVELHAGEMVEAGALEVVSKRDDAEVGAPLYFFPPPGVWNR